jgi:uncharacterized membrane protein
MTMDPVELSTEPDAGPESTPQFEMDEIVGYVLLGGVLLSLALVATGLIWKWFATGSVALDYRLTGMNLFEFVVSEIRLALHDRVRPRLLVNFGIIVLMLTPFVRVLASVVYFAAFLKNWKYTLFTSFVLVVLTYSLFLR